jgi:hypothetical protein
VHSRELAFGQSHVFYPEASNDRCTATLLLDIDPVGLARGRHQGASLERLGSRHLAGKRGLAAREFALGIEGLERFVRHEPLRRVHECAFAVLAMESEPVDPRL